MNLTSLQKMIFKDKRPDVACISFPKSGRTWVRFALGLAGSDVEFTHAGYGTKDVKEIGNAFDRVYPRYFGRRNILLYRNPLDVAVSMYHQIHNRNFSPSNPQYEEIRSKLASLDRLPPQQLDDFVLHPVWGCGNVAAYNAAHLKHFEGDHDAITVRYEELRADPRTHFARMLDFAGTKNYDIDKVVEGSSFERMRAIELGEDREVRKTHRLYGLHNGDENTLKVRKGEVRGYRHALRPETIERAAAICAANGQAIEG